MKAKRQDKLRPKAFPSFLVGSSVNHPHDIYEVLLYSGSVVDCRNVTWVWLLPSISVSAKNVPSVFVSGKGGKLDPSRHGVVKRDKDVDCDESSESTVV